MYLECYFQFNLFKEFKVQRSVVDFCERKPTEKKAMTDAFLL